MIFLDDRGGKICAWENWWSVICSPPSEKIWEYFSLFSWTSIREKRFRNDDDVIPWEKKQGDEISPSRICVRPQTNLAAREKSEKVAEISSCHHHTPTLSCYHHRSFSHTFMHACMELVDIFYLVWSDLSLLSFPHSVSLFAHLIRRTKNWGGRERYYYECWWPTGGERGSRLIFFFLSHAKGEKKQERKV